MANDEKNEEISSATSKNAPTFSTNQHDPIQQSPASSASSSVHEVIDSVSKQDPRRSIRMTRSLLDDDDEEEEDDDESENAEKEQHNISPKSRDNNVDKVAHDSELSSKTTLATIGNGIFPRQHAQLLSRQAPPTNSILNASGTIIKWNEFVQRTHRIKDALDEIVKNVHDYSGRTNKKRDRNGILESVVDDDGQQPSQDLVMVAPKRMRVMDPTTAELAREKTEEALILQRQLKEAKARSTSLKAANLSLREEANAAKTRLERTIHALELAGSNADKARADAEAAEATAANLAQTLECMEQVVAETKRASQILHLEHKQVSDAANSLEGRLLQQEIDWARAKHELKELKAVNESLERAQTEWQDERNAMLQKQEILGLELETLKREKADMIELENARKKRTQDLEEDWRKAQSMLVELSAAQTESASTQAAMNNTIEELRKTNQELNERLSNQQESTREQSERLLEKLSKAEAEVRELKIQSEAAQDQLQRAHLEKSIAEKQVANLKEQIVGLEQKLEYSSNRLGSGLDPMVKNVVNIPPTDHLSKEKENVAGITSGQTCCICFKATFGIMKACQCGIKDCRKRAHSNCVLRIVPGPSVSHPGTPAPRLPVVLCGNAFSLKRQSTGM